MVYAASDLHGCPLDGFLRLLDRAGFSESDFLFVLGDVIDRNGDGGIAMLEWLMARPNAELLLGNHEGMLLSCGFLFEEITDESLRRLDSEQIALLLAWMEDGAGPTLEGLRKLRRRDPEQLAALMEYLREAPLYDTAQAGGRDFLLVHAGLGHFRPDRPLEDYDPEELLWHRPDPEERYFPDVLTILGHTPTAFYGAPGRMFRTPTWIDIDVGAGSGLPPMLLRLDTLEAFYED